MRAHSQTPIAHLQWTFTETHSIDNLRMKMFACYYLDFVTKQCRNTAICTLVNSVPTQNLMPPPKAMKFLDAPFTSVPCTPVYFIIMGNTWWLEGWELLLVLKCPQVERSFKHNPPSISMDWRQVDRHILLGLSVQRGDRPLLPNLLEWYILPCQFIL